jgi:transcriptional regulator with XRE-family HTH domain
MTQQALASAACVSIQQIEKYELGTNRVPASMLVHLAQALRAPVSLFLDDLPSLDRQSARLPHFGRMHLQLVRYFDEVRPEPFRTALYRLVKVAARATRRRTTKA